MSGVRGQSGNILFALFAAVALVGVLGASMTSLLRGPTRTVAEVARNTEVSNDMIAATALLSEAALEQTSADCDLDGMIEPVIPTDSAAAPAGGGLLPPQIGAKRQDPWGSAYGYCVWDLGSKVHDAACGGPASGRRAGGNTAVAAAIALISAGRDKVFQASCLDWADGNTPLIDKPIGSDDIVRIYPYGQFMLPRLTQSVLKELPDEGCTPATIGMLRMALGVVQVCTDTGWEEVGTAAQADSSFLDVTNASPEQEYSSNTVTFSGFLNQKNIVLTGGGVLLVNNLPSGTSAMIRAGDEIAIRANAAATPETTLTFGISVAGVKRSWNIRTRDRYPADLTMTPATAAFTVTGPAAPSYSGVESFIMRNAGEMDSLPIASVSLSNMANFEYHSDGSYVGDACTGQVLSADETCVIDLRAMASMASAFSGMLNATDGVHTVSATLSGNATGFTCPLPWGGTLNEGQSVVAYQNSTVPYGNSCTSTTRTCTAGALTGLNYTNQTCTMQSPSNCTLDGATVSHGSSRTFYTTASVPCGSSCSGISRTCTNGSFSGTASYDRANCSVAACANCTLDGATVSHGSSRAFYSTTSVACGGSCTSYRQTRTCTNGSLSGSSSYDRANCNTATCANCTLDGVTVAHGSSRTFYSASAQSPCSGSCSGGSSRTCNNGILSGSGNYASCSCTCSPQMGQSCAGWLSSKTIAGTCHATNATVCMITYGSNCPDSSGGGGTTGAYSAACTGAATAGQPCSASKSCWGSGTRNCFGTCVAN